MATPKAAGSPEKKASANTGIESQIIVGVARRARDKQTREQAVETLNGINARLRELPATILDCYVMPGRASGPPMARALMRLDDPDIRLRDLQKALRSKEQTFRGVDLSGIAYFDRNAPVRSAAFADLRAGEQWALAKLGVPDTWPTVPNSTVLLAIIDSGLRRPDGNLHADLGAVESLADCQPQPDSSTSPPDPGLYLDNVDQDGHGTMLAGTMAAVPNAIGIASPIPGDWPISLLPVKFFGTDGPPNVYNACKAMDHAVAKGARVINASWHVGLGRKDVQALKESIRNAKQAECLVVAAAGNDGSDNLVYETYPANFGSDAEFKKLTVLTVAATDRHDYKASFSNFGPTIVDLAAPGKAILTTGRYLVDPPRYQFYSGTSASAAFASAGAALVLALNPGWKPKAVITHLVASAEALPQLATTCIGGKRLSLGRAVLGPLAVTAPAGGATATVGQVTQIAWTNDYVNPDFDKIRIELIKDDGTVKVLDSNADNATGYFNWTPTNAHRTSAGRIRITPRKGNFPALSGTIVVV